MTKTTLALVAASLTLGSALATEIRIYPSFSEVRQPVQSEGNTLRLSLSPETWAGILPGSLDLEGLSFDSLSLQQNQNWLSTQEGKTVYLRGENGQTQPVTLVRALDLLVKDAQGRYFNVQMQDLQFDAAPPLYAQRAIQTLEFKLPAAGKGTLSYLTRSMNWSPRYTLKASAAGANLSALADIRNNSDNDYQIEKTELYAGDVEVGGDYNDYGRGMPVSPAPVMMMADSAPAPKIAAMGEMRGLYRYELNQPFTLPARSTVTLPFAAPKLTSFERYAGMNTYFQPQNSEGTLTRFYRFKADDRLPSGSVTVREDGRIVGQATISETAKGAEAELRLGNDPDLRYSRTVQRLEQQKDKNGRVVKQTFKVTYSFESTKATATRAEITERIGGQRVWINGKEVQNDDANAEIKVNVPAGSKATATFTITIDNS